MRPIAVFYHCMFSIGARTASTIEPTRPPLTPGALPAAVGIVRSQMEALARSGLLGAANRLFIGVNGGPECFAIAAELFPPQAIVSFHGLGCRNELRTILMLERFVQEVTHLESGTDWSVCYHHAKGASYPTTDDQSVKWRRCMEKHVVDGWRSCVDALDKGYDAAGAHYLSPPLTPVDQRIFAGNFFWARSRYLATLTPLLERERLRLSGVDPLESRFEAEVYVGNSARPPRIMDFHPKITGNGFPTLGAFDGCETAIPEIKEV